MTEKAGNDGDGLAGVVDQCNQERTIAREHRLLLGRVQVFEEIAQGFG